MLTFVGNSCFEWIFDSIVQDPLKKFRPVGTVGRGKILLCAGRPYQNCTQGGFITCHRPHPVAQYGLCYCNITFLPAELEPSGSLDIAHSRETVQQLLR